MGNRDRFMRNVIKPWRITQLGCQGALVLSMCWLPAQADISKAGRFYEDALSRYERGDLPGAIIQLKNSLQQDAKMLPAHLLLGKALLQHGDLKGAEAALEAALQQGVSPSEVMAMLAQVYLALGKPEQVLAKVPAAGLPARVQVELLSLRGTAYAELGKSLQARQSFEMARALDPRSPLPLIAEVPLQLGSGQLESARRLAAQAIELAPNNPQAWNMHASVLHLALDLPGALKAYGRALSLQPKYVDARVAKAALLVDMRRDAEARQELAQLRKDAPEEPRAAYLRALLASQQGDMAEATQAISEVVKLIDALRPAWLARREQLLMVGALAHHAQGNLEKAREYLSSILTRNSHNTEARKLLAGIYAQKRDFSRALTLLGDLKRDLPNDPQVLYLLGSVHMAMKHYQQATELLEQAATRVNSGELTRALAFSLLGQGQSELGRASLQRALAANPADAQAGMALATLQMRRGEIKAALATAESLVKYVPDNLTVLNFLGSLKAASADKAGARSAFQAILAKDPAFPSAVLNLAKLEVSEVRFAEARQRLNSFLAKRRDHPDALFELGLLEFQAGRPAEAIRQLQRANELQRNDTRPGMALIEIQLAQRQFQAALGSAKGLRASYPDQLPVLLTLARVHLALADLPNARSVLQEATRLAEFNADMQLQIARLYLQSNSTDAAYYSAQKALQGRPGDPAALALLVEIELRRGAKGRPDEALKLLSVAHPNHVLTALAAGDLAMLREQYPLAVTHYSKALQRAANTANLHKLAQAHLAMGQPAKAAELLSNWVSKRPDDILALKTLAEMQFRAGQLQAAKQNYARAIALTPNDAVALNNYSNLLLKLKDPAARTYAEQALKLAPNDPAYADTLGWVLVQQGQLEAGLRYLREARLRNPESPDVRYHLAYALSQSGRKAEAREELRAALDSGGAQSEPAAYAALAKELGL